MASVEKVLIVGGGIGGLCTAIALGQAGIAVEIVELNPRWDVYGVGIIQQANALRALAALGLVDKALAEGYGMDALELHTPTGQLIARIPQPRLAGPQFPATNAMARPRLHAILQDGVRQSRAQVRLGLTVNALDQTPDGVHVTFTDGTSDRYDLVVGADGLRSVVRKLIFGAEYQPEYEQQMVWRYNLPKPAEVQDIWMFMGIDPRVGFVPMSPNLMYIFLVETPGNDANRRIPDDQLAPRFRELLSVYPPGPVAAIREGITDSSKVVHRPFDTLLVPPPWHRGRVVLVGDSAHAMTAHIAQGAGMVMEDAVVLGEELIGQDEVGEALHRYTNRRYERCKAFVDLSRLMCRWEREHTPNADTEGLIRRSLEIAAQPI
jgi:2-polyprenyl-6-methoxyphenol hydroxylase-like FAD-dependent oxidoreductase